MKQEKTESPDNLMPILLNGIKNALDLVIEYQKKENEDVQKIKKDIKFIRDDIERQADEIIIKY